MSSRHAATAVVLGWLVVSLHGQQPQPPGTPRRRSAGLRFKSGVELINVTATVSDANGRFVPGLQQDDFIVYEDDQPETVTHFSAERVPVSLGIALDTSGSMAGEKIRGSARARSIASSTTCSTGRTRSSSTASATRRCCCRAGRRIASCWRARSAASRRTAARRCTTPSPRRSRWPQQGQNRKKALLVISDGNDTASATTRPRAEGADSRERSAGLRDRHRRRGRDAIARRPPPPRAPMPPPFPRPFPGAPGRLGGRPPTCRVSRRPAARRRISPRPSPATIASTSPRCAT